MIFLIGSYHLYCIFVDVFLGDMMNEPLTYFYRKTGFDRNNIRRLVLGEKYVGLELQNGNIGVCATLDHPVAGHRMKNTGPDLGQIPDRIIYNAYLNATLNDHNDYREQSDIFDKINFSGYSNVVMIGYFESLIQKFEKENISLSVFDKIIYANHSLPLDEMYTYLHEADALVLTGTTICNGTFLEIVHHTVKGEIFVLGPSTILCREMFSYHENIRVLFGAVFEKGDQRVLDEIAKGSGTKQFLPYMKKVFLTC